MMTIDEAERRIEEIRALACDDERAHAAEDTLWHDALSAIANGECDDPAKLAAVVLGTGEIEFSRWYA